MIITLQRIRVAGRPALVWLESLARLANEMEEIEEQGLALEVEASDELSVTDVVARAAHMGAPFAVVVQEGTALGVLAVGKLSPSSILAVDAARATPTVAPQTVQVELPGGEALEVDLQVQGDGLAIWDRGHEYLVVSLGDRDVAAALTSRVMAFAAADTELPGPERPLDPRYYTYVCRNRHYVRLASDDPNKTCRKCGWQLYRI